MTIDPSLLDQVKANPVLAGALGLWSAAMLTFITKDIPASFLKIIRKQCTTSLEVTSQEEEFTSLTRWIERKGFSRRFRRVRVKNKEISAGFGRHYFLYQWRLCWFFRDRVENKDGTDLEEVTVSYLGRDQRFLRDLIQSAIDNTFVSDQTRIYVPRWKGWSLLATQPKRSLDSVLLPPLLRRQIHSHFDAFFESREWHRFHGIPYRTGMCLYGQPGTGKTSLVRAICAHYDLRLYTIDLSNTTDQALKELVWSVGTRSMILMEDIDTISAAQDRSETKTACDSERVTLSGLLNAIDGVVDSDGRVFAFTTNHIERIDPALLRPGRADLKIELGAMTTEMFSDAFRKFAPTLDVPGDLQLRSDVTPAEFQRLFLDRKISHREVLEKLKYERAGPEFKMG
jgi:chaperone BCS1